MVTETVEAEGHLIDSGNLQAILTTIVEHPAEYEILRLDVGRTNESPSRLSLKLLAPTERVAAEAAGQALGVRLLRQGHAATRSLRAADMDGAAPDDFYSTTNHRTSVLPRRPVGRRRTTSAWTPSSWSSDGRATCRKLRDVRAGRPRRVRHAGHPRAAGSAGARQAHLRVHEQRGVVGATRRDRGGARRRHDAARASRAAAASRSSPGRSSSTPAAATTSAS